MYLHAEHNKGQTLERVDRLSALYISEHTQRTEKAQPFEDRKLNKIINEEELTKQLTFSSQSSNGLQDRVTNYLHKTITQANPTLIYTHQKIIESLTWLNRVGVGGSGRA